MRVRVRLKTTDGFSNVEAVAGSMLEAVHKLQGTHKRVTGRRVRFSGDDLAVWVDVGKGWQRVQPQRKEA